jgi:antibiotic biosynthesis monooxygenase (ABM) superfamily enzyme
MNDFWNNISRYPRFFISSLIGLILIIISPFRNLFKIPRLRFILIPSIVLIIAFFSFILKTMVGL